MRRREFITVLGGAAAGWPLAARAQQAVMPVIGFMSSRSPEDSESVVAAFRKGVSEGGLVEGRNVLLEFRWARGEYNRLPNLAADLLARRVAVIVSPGMAPTLAAKAATTTIPIVFLTGADPVQFGLVASLNRPGGNLTGLTLLNNTLVPKQLEMLHELVPSATLVAFLVNPKNPISEADTKDSQAAASITRQQILALDASTESDINNAFIALTQQGANALLVQTDPLFNGLHHHIAGLAARYRVPAVSSLREFVEAGGLMSYGTALADGNRQLGLYAAKIIKGANPSDLPVEQSAKVELLINVRAAKALGLSIPPSLLARADEVIE
jgi:putative tryptophan/tyrosine transport system substrate-binding protein